jgi:hypothetical protein
MHYKYLPNYLKNDGRQTEIIIIIQDNPIYALYEQEREILMQKHFRVHGDNIVECERVIKYITQGVKVLSQTKRFSSLACLTVDINFEYERTNYQWSIEMFPGFSKDNRGQRWKSNIFEALKDNGSFLDETPDVVVSKVENELETILFAIEFCSALQAGNQAWQRSGRAYSAGRAKCPYIYIVDFVKYELNSETRERKALRFPNPAVPYSYISFSRFTGGFVAQAYTKAEEFRENADVFETFKDEWFSESLISEFFIKKMNCTDTEEIEKKILNNNFNVVAFLAAKSEGTNRFSIDDWKNLYESGENIIEFTKNRENGFNFEKTIAKKSYNEEQGVGEFLKVVKEYSGGIASKDLPFGFIPISKINEFTTKLKGIYPHISSEFDVLESLIEDCVICMVKGFKPKGDDNRPDRGVLPLTAMLASENVYIMAYIYGPLIERNYKLLLSNPLRLSETSGFWRAFLSLSDFILIDSPLLNEAKEVVNKFIDNRDIKQQYLKEIETGDFSRPPVSNIPNGYREDDVDTVLHFIFSYLLENTFEGMCNPPGGDWSGLSIYLNDTEYRWLSLPRVSHNNKRPDHVSEMFIENRKPLLFVIESKEFGNTLEENIGVRLKGYIMWLMNFTPSVYKKSDNEWYNAEETIDIENFEIVSVGAYIDDSRYDNSKIMEKSKCDLLFIFMPDESLGLWKIKIMANSASKKAEDIKTILYNQLEDKKDGVQVRR